MKTKRVRLDKIMVSKPVPSGMNPLVVMSLTHKFRATNEDVEPILLRKEGRWYRITDGRHRYVASLIAGRRRVLARIEE